jgi:cytochrome c-type biogenesis protein CcmH/NrfG
MAHLKLAVEGNSSDINSKFFYAIGLFVAGQYDDSGHYQELVVDANPSAANIGILAEIYYAQQVFGREGKGIIKM